MSLLFAIALLFSLSGGSKPPQRIVGGQTAPHGGFPYQASVRGPNGTHICGGAIITTSAVLTAAHCVRSYSTWEISIVVGTNGLDSGGFKYAVSDVVQNRFNPVTMANDVAVLKLSGELRPSSTVQPIPIANETVAPGTQVLVSGWGAPSAGGSFSPELQYGAVTTISIQECKKTWRVNEKQLCTLEGSKGACSGDGGGPAVRNGEVVGVLSYGQPCAVGYPDVYADVASYYSWINSLV